MAVLASLAVRGAQDVQDDMENKLQEDMKCSLMELSVAASQGPEVGGQKLEVMSVEAGKVQMITWSQLQEAINSGEEDLVDVGMDENILHIELYTGQVLNIHSFTFIN